jgi:hypothetical protein
MVEQIRHEKARSPRERLARYRSLLGRGLKYWKGSLVVLAVAGVASGIAAWRVQHVYRSECTVLAKARIRTDDRDDSSSSPDQVLRQSARLKDMLTTRSRLESAIKKFALYRDTVAGKSMLDAVEQMKPHVGFRALEGAQYVISFDGDDAETVRRVTEFLSQSLISDYAATDLDDLEREANFLAEEEQRSLSGLEDSTRALTVFLAEHPEFALEAKQAAGSPFGPSPAAGIPLMPKIPKDSALAADPELSALYRERARLDAAARSSAAIGLGVVAATGSDKQLDDQIAQAQGEVEQAAKRVAETQGDLASKSNLTEDHPDMRAARMAVDAAARQLHEAKVKLAALQQVKGGVSGGPAADPSKVPRDILDKLRQIDAQIAARGAQASRAHPSAGETASASTSPAVAQVVALETDWQRLLRGLNEAKNHHDDLKLRAQRAKLALEAARAQASERMAVLDPPFRPTHPSKGARMNVALGGLVAAWLLALAYATARVSTDDTLIDADDIEALGLTPVLGVVPRLARPGSPKETQRDAAA